MPVTEIGMEDLIREVGSLGLLLKDELSTLRSDQTRIIMVGKDVVVPVMSEQHPCREQILKQGISPIDFSRAFSGHPPKGLHVHPVWSGERVIGVVLSDFLQLDADQLEGRKTGGWKETLAYLRTHTDAIGFCRLSEVLDENGQALQTGLKLVPIDLNGNTSIEPLEDMYRSTKDLLSPLETSFLQWMISERQEQLNRVLKLGF